jgi:hypothetical protein
VLVLVSLSVTSYSNRPRLSDGSLYIILERIKSLNELGGLDMGCVEYWWRKGRKLIADPNANVVERPHGLGLITRFPKFVGGFISRCPGGKSVFKYFMLTTRADLPPELLPCDVLQGEEIRIVENNMNSSASLCSLISSSAIMNGYEDIPINSKRLPPYQVKVS